MGMLFLSGKQLPVFGPQWFPLFLLFPPPGVPCHPQLPLMGASLRAQGKCHVLGEAALITLPEMVSSSHVSYIMLLTYSQTPVMALQYLSSRYLPHLRR